MKAYLLPCYFCALVIIFSNMLACKKSDDTTATIVGEWEARSETVRLSNTSTSPPTPISNSTESYAPGHGAYVSLKADHTYFYKDSAAAAAQSESGTYTYDNGLLITTPGGSSSGDTARIVLSGDSFVLAQSEQQGTLFAEFSFTFFHP